MGRFCRSGFLGQAFPDGSIYVMAEWLSSLECPRGPSSCWSLTGVLRQCLSCGACAPSGRPSQPSPASSLTGGRQTTRVFSLKHNTCSTVRPIEAQGEIEIVL